MHIVTLVLGKKLKQTEKLRKVVDGVGMKTIENLIYEGKTTVMSGVRGELLTEIAVIRSTMLSKRLMKSYGDLQVTWEE